MPRVEVKVTLEEMIDALIYGELNAVVHSNSARFLSFNLLADAIEFLGACIDDDHPFDATGRSGARVCKALVELFTFDDRYKKNRDSIRDGLRNSMAHQMRPSKEIGFVTQWDSPNAKLSHLRIDEGSGRLILVRESLYDDIRKATYIMKHRLRKGGHTHKLDEPFRTMYKNVPLQDK
ncbi:MAG: hypothetical protein CL946_06660 [Ectothiorhodospiraceae bacterium]|nr:hypothetical protein [Ectothiorhodospiraceae bacterium]